MEVFTFSCGESISLAVFLKSPHILPVSVRIRKEELDNPNEGPSIVTKRGYRHLIFLTNLELIQYSSYRGGSQFWGLRVMLPTVYTVHRATLVAICALELPAPNNHNVLSEF